MEPVREIVARAVPLDRSDVDTDQIIPSDWLKRVERTGFGEGLFSEWRESSDFVLNQEHFDGAQILVAGPNFGTGSSREHAPWALEDYGFRAVISPRFADIFRNNCLKIGLLPVELPAEVVTRIMRAVEDDPTIEIVIDVVDRRVAVPAIDLDEPFDLSDFHHYRLLEGLDDIGLTLRHTADIDAFEATRPTYTPRVARLDPNDPNMRRGCGTIPLALTPERWRRDVGTASDVSISSWTIRRPQLVIEIAEAHHGVFTARHLARARRQPTRPHPSSRYRALGDAYTRACTASSDAARPGAASSSPPAGPAGSSPRLTPERGRALGTAGAERTNRSRSRARDGIAHRHDGLVVHESLDSRHRRCRLGGRIPVTTARARSSTCERRRPDHPRSGDCDRASSDARRRPSDLQEVFDRLGEERARRA